jgi:hypothetical protein
MELGRELDKGIYVVLPQKHQVREEQQRLCLEEAFLQCDIFCVPAGPSTINNTTNNNNTNNITNNIHIYTDERTAKQLKQSVLPFLMAPPPS